MYELDRESFSKFIAEQRRLKGYTQKQLAERLFVSDKAVSKWERSLSMPDISLLIPLAEALEVSVTELLEGRKLDPESEMKAEKVEELVQKALNLETPEEKGKRRKHDIAVFGSCVLFMVLESGAGLWMLSKWQSGNEDPAAFMASLGGIISILVLSALSFSFGIYFWFFIRERLPRYYDENRICVYSQGYFNLSLPGISFHNGSWPYMLKALRIWSAVTMTTAPLTCLLIAFSYKLFPAGWIPFFLHMTAIGLYLGGMFVPLYIVNRKYGRPECKAAAEQEAAREQTKDAGHKNMAVSLILSVAVLLTVFLIVYAVRIAGLGTEYSGVRMGYVQSYTSQEWSASYRLLNGMVSRTVQAPADSGICILEIETTKGSISVEMTDGAGNIIFSDTDLQPGVYEVQLSGATRIRFTGKDHGGGFSVSFHKESSR